MTEGGIIITIKRNWIFCPICGNKTHDRIREDTVLKNYPLYCSKCKPESLIEAKQIRHLCSSRPWSDS